MDNTIIAQYNLNADAAKKEYQRYERLVNVYSVGRLTVFALLLIAIYFSVDWESMQFLVLALVLIGGCFSWLVKKQSEFEEQKKYFDALRRVNENEADSILNYGNIYDHGERYENDKHHYISDLDIFGHASLFRLVNRTATPAGRDLLASWLERPAQKADIEKRQAGVKELGAKNSWKLDIQARLLFGKDEKDDVLNKLFSYLSFPVNLSNEKLLDWYCKVAPFIMLALVTLSFFFPLAAVAGLYALLNLVIVFTQGKAIIKTSVIISKTGATLNNYALVFKSIEDEPWQSELLVHLATQIRLEGGFSVSAKIKQLAALADKFNYSSNMIIGALLNMVFLWNIKQTIAIERWKRRNHESFEHAFDVIAAFEALYSLASLQVNYPDWHFPEIAEGEGYTLTASRVGHPLIKLNSRVTNDYELTDAFKIDIITGSNMAGKSTFLRTLGINMVLALSGGPVCAQHMRVSVMNVFTYMRIKDSLNESTSTFKAELDRLQLLLHVVNAHEKVFFLIDEMLRGTNSVDKYLGSKAVIEQLIKKHGVGLVATHDLQIAELEKTYPDYIRNFYFDIQVKDGEMLFDYKLKPGECKTFNASMLLKRIGIEIG